MRIIHTGDWHIGQTLGGFSREHEHRSVLSQLTRIVEERQADALVIAGDIFDSQNPSGESQALFYDGLDQLHRARPQLSIVITAGNHDAARRLEAPGPLLKRWGVHIVGNVLRREGRVDFRRHVIPLKSPSGEVRANVLAVSYPTAACLPPLSAFGGDIARATADLYAELMEQAEPHLGGLPLVVTGHLHVAGGLESEGAERRILVGGQHAIRPQDLPEDADYIALGHLHKAQAIGRETIRYCGSLIPLSSTEQPYRHGVTLVELGDRAGAPVRTEQIPLKRPVPYLRLPARGDVRLADLGDHLQALGLETGLPVEQHPFLHVQLAREGIVTGFRAEADRIASAFPVRLVDIRLTPLPERTSELATADTAIRLADLAPEELFLRAFQRQHGVAAERTHLDLFHRLEAER